MQFTKAIVVLSALAGFTYAAPVADAEAQAEIDERHAGIALTFTGTNGTSYSLNAPNNWKPLKTEQPAIVNKITIKSALSTCIFIGGRGNFFVEAALFGSNTFNVNPAQSIQVVACAGLAGNIIHF